MTEQSTEQVVILCQVQLRAPAGTDPVDLVGALKRVLDLGHEELRKAKPGYFGNTARAMTAELLPQKELAWQLVAPLNAALGLDARAVRRVMNRRVACAPALHEQGRIPVVKTTAGDTVGALGLINASLKGAGLPRIAVGYKEVGRPEDFEMFVPYTPDVGGPEGEEHFDPMVKM